MPRIIRDIKEPRARSRKLVRELAEELKTHKESGQPIIKEERFPRTQAVRVSVFWDKWKAVPDQDRVATILDAYELVEGPAFRDHIAIASGLTVPEARSLGLLPVRVVPMLRQGDPVTMKQCRAAMKAEGASVLSDPNDPDLRFETREEAEKCIERLIERLPGSERVWSLEVDFIPTYA